MKLLQILKNFTKETRVPKLGGLEIFKYIGPGLLVTVGFIDPGNWASNVAAGSNYGYVLLWMVSLSTLMLILLQHNAAHLGIVSGLCLSEAASKYIKPLKSRLILSTAVMASISTALAEILGGALALNMLFHIPLKIGALMIVILVSFMIYSNSYKSIEKWIIGFVSLIGLCFIFELSLVDIDWPVALKSWLIPSFPSGSLPVIMSVLGAVVMPHNLFLHSEIIQSRQWNLENDTVIKKQLKYEFTDTLISMLVGWGINSAMILLAAAAFFQNQVQVNELQQAASLLTPLLGSAAFVVFALALLFSGIASSITAGMASGSIFAGIFHEPYDIKDKHSRVGVGGTFLLAFFIILFIDNPFQGLILSQIFLSVQLPITIFTLIYLTSSKKVMGKYVNRKFSIVLLLSLGLIVSALNVMLLISLF